MVKFKPTLLGLAFVVLAACTSLTGTPEQQFLKAATTGAAAVDQAALAADSAVKAGVLKGQDAQNVLQAIKTAQQGLAIAYTLDPAQGVTKIQMTLAILAAAQTYLATVPKTPPIVPPTPASGAQS